jgi:hypothetical protein
LDDFCSTWLTGKGAFPARLILFIFAWFTWAPWITRNRMAIDKKFPKLPTDVIYTALSLLQNWSVKLKDKDQERILQVRDEMLCWLKNFKPNPLLMSDVVEISFCSLSSRLRNYIQPVMEQCFSLTLN